MTIDAVAAPVRPLGSGMAYSDADISAASVAPLRAAARETSNNRMMTSSTPPTHPYTIHAPSHDRLCSRSRLLDEVASATPRSAAKTPYDSTRTAAACMALSSCGGETVCAMRARERESRESLGRPEGCSLEHVRPPLSWSGDGRDAHLAMSQCRRPAGVYWSHYGSDGRTDDAGWSCTYHAIRNVLARAGHFLPSLSAIAAMAGVDCAHATLRERWLEPRDAERVLGQYGLHGTAARVAGGASRPRSAFTRTAPSWGEGVGDWETPQAAGDGLLRHFATRGALPVVCDDGVYCYTISGAALGPAERVQLQVVDVHARTDEAAAPKDADCDAFFGDRSWCLWVPRKAYVADY